MAFAPQWKSLLVQLGERDDNHDNAFAWLCWLFTHRGLLHCRDKPGKVIHQFSYHHSLSGTLLRFWVFPSVPVHIQASRVVTHFPPNLWEQDVLLPLQHQGTWSRGYLERFHTFFKQIQEDLEKGNITTISPLPLLMNLISMTIFPFIAKPMFQLNLGLDEFQFRHAMEQRRKEIPKFIIDAIRK